MPNYNLAAGPNPQYPAFMPSPEPLAMLFKGLGMDGSSSKRSNKTSEEGDDSSKLIGKMLPGDYKSYEKKRISIDSDYKTEELSIINELAKNGNKYADDVLIRMKENNIKRRSRELELEQWVGLAIDNKVKHKEQTQKLATNTWLVDAVGNPGIEVNGIRLYTTEQLNAYNETKSYNEKFEEYEGLDLKYYETMKDQIFSNLAEQDISAAYTEIKDKYTQDANGDWIPVQETINKGLGGQLGQVSTNAVALNAAINQWYNAIDTDPVLERVFNYKRWNWNNDLDSRLKDTKTKDEKGRTFADVYNSNKYTGAKSYEQQMLSDLQGHYAKSKTVGGISYDYSQKATGALKLSAPAAVENGTYLPTAVGVREISIGKNGEYTQSISPLPRWSLTEDSFAGVNNTINKNMGANNPSRIQDLFGSVEYFWNNNGVPQDIDLLIDNDVIVTKVTGNIDMKHSAKVQYTITNEKIVSVPTNNKVITSNYYKDTEQTTFYGELYNPDFTVRENPDVASFTFDTKPTFGLEVRILIPESRRGYWLAFSNSQGYNTAKKLNKFDNINSLEGEDPSNLRKVNVSADQRKQFGFPDEKEYWETKLFPLIC